LKILRPCYLTAAITACAIGLSACNGAVTPLKVSVSPGIGSLYAVRGTIDPSSSCNTPNPTPSAPDPQAWWTGIDPQTRQTKVVVGYQYWSNANAGCDTTRQDVYRGVAAYDLATIKALSTASTPIQSLITNAKVQLTVGAGAPSPATVGTCSPNFGGMGAIEQLRPGYTILTGLTTVPVVPPITGTPSFPPGANSTSASGVAVPGSTGRWTTSVGGLGLTVIDYDVKDLVIGALTRGDANFGIMLDGTTETLIQSIANPQVDCRTLVTVGPLTVEHL